MATMTIDLPDKVFSELKSSPRGGGKGRTACGGDRVVYRRGLLSQGRAAELAGVPQADFIDELARRKVEVFRVDLEELKAEIGLA